MLIFIHRVFEIATEFIRDYDACYPNTLDRIALDLASSIRTDQPTLSKSDIDSVTELWEFEFFADLIDSAGFYIHSSDLA